MQGLLIKCAVDKKPVEIIYQSKKGTISQRTILIKKVNQQQILAYCYQKRQIRSFIIEQILAVQPVKKRFTTPA
ncbi:WYL domain-containing protein [Pallidibacillus pasinlerensis]|uniref:WYL domain-containing protein n=1 Tax=Pallidibacillus pasinlerensis TaxID=2703818 RepID=A0ABX0A4N6_9BACI|nr:WYL domain-containing protein [Pallidibacillus pasinlerensis]NCU18380.1 WYL domain-containing protein [Pallidibacillus pasinlerensis]